MSELDIHRETAALLLEASAPGIVEDLTGLPYHDPAVSGLTIHMHNEIETRRRAMLSELCDTYWGISWQSFGEVLADTDFRVLLQDRLTLISRYGEHDTIVACDDRRRLLLIADSSEFGLNRADIYGMVDGTVSRGKQASTYHSLADLPASCGPLGTTEFYFHADVREGFKLQLAKLDEAELLHRDWIPSPLLAPWESASPDSAERIKAVLPEWVRVA